jgi:excisionase family DNA binding protein
MHTKFTPIEPVRWLTVADIADRAYCGESSVRRWIKKKLLKAYKLGRDWKIDPTDFQDFVEKSANISD